MKQKTISRNYDIVTYLDHERLGKILEEKLSQIYRCAFILHDKDDKKAHTHLFLCLKDAKSPSAVLKWFTKDGFKDDKGSLINTRIRIEPNPLRCVRYLTHLDNPEKFQYSVNDVTSLNLDVEAWYSKPFIPERNSDCLANALIFLVEKGLNHVTIKQCVDNYGRDFIMAYNQIRRIYYDIQNSQFAEDYAIAGKLIERTMVNDDGEVLEQISFN